MNKAMKIRLQDAILDHISGSRVTVFVPVRGESGGWGTEEKAEEGESLSFLQKSLRESGWHFRGNEEDFRALVQDLGFTVNPGKNARGNRGRYVYL